MLKDLSQGIKISITRSISTVFEQYMATIGWSEDKYNMEDFMREWREYINRNASWFDNVSEEIKAHPSFHEELAGKINETIHKILSEEPTAQQVETIEELQKQLGVEHEYTCKAEARYVIDYLENELKKKLN